MRPRLWLWSPVSSTHFSSTTESSPSDSPATTSDRCSHSLPHSAGPSHKRCMSPTTTMPSSIALSPTHVDLLLPRKRFRDSYSSEDSIEEDIDADVLADIEADAAAAEATTHMDVEAGVDAGIRSTRDFRPPKEEEYEIDIFGDHGYMEDELR
ncbi:hypothetical protein Tco_0115463 [Tanacetum coccineum]